MTIKTERELVAAVKAVAEPFGFGEFFHLSKCHQCNCPSWGQPCYLCNYYYSLWGPPKDPGLALTEDHFEELMNRAPLLTRYARELTSIVAYESQKTFRDRADRFIEAAKNTHLDVDYRAIYREVNREAVN